MSYKSRIYFTSAMALPLCLLLSACGGGGTTEVASIPPPPVTPTPTPTPAPKPTSISVETSWLDSPATRAGTYDLIAIINQTVNGTPSSRSAAPGEFRLENSQSNLFHHTLYAPSGFLPEGLSELLLPWGTISWDFNAGGPNYRYDDSPYGDYAQYFGQNLKEYDVYPDGSKTLGENYDFGRTSIRGGNIELPTGGHISEGYQHDVGYSYVAMGEWDWQPVTINPDGTATPTGSITSIYFAYGDRTPASGIPPSGTASYDAHTLADLPFTLTADFSQRSISTQISKASLLDVSGSASFSNDGSFDIPLAGSAGAQSASGNMNGAFFGPNAEQVGGTFSLQNSGGVQLMQDAFVGQQHHP